MSPAGKPQPTARSQDLWRQLHFSAANDLNPWTCGYGGELLSKLAHLHPEADRLTCQELALPESSWLTADGLFLAAELAESRGSDLAELAAADRKLRLLGLRPEGREAPWRGLSKAGLTAAPVRPGRCPFWGPCLGRRSYLTEILEELGEELALELTDDFRVELVGCPRDCRQAVERADLAAVLDEDASGLVIWLGGRHRPFRDLVTPKAWLREELNDVRGFLELVFKVHDLWSRTAVMSETLPELAARAGLDRLERILAAGRQDGLERLGSQGLTGEQG
jgi:hypothetical protein